MRQPAKSRVTVDFPIPERDALQVLCDADLRPAAEQIRWLVLNEAKRRGLEFATEPMHNRASQVLADPSAAAA